MDNRLTITSCMAGNMDFIGHLLAPYLTEKLSLSSCFVGDIPWQERERRFDAGEIDIVWICGLPTIRKMANPLVRLTLLAAPVPAGARYGGKPVYFSDIVVRRDGPFRRFADLRGATWSYNEPNSHSGYTAIRYYLARRGESGDFFGRVIESGSHEKSLHMILNGEIDGSAIDSTVLELEMARDPELAGKLRVLDSIGPSPAPPLLAGSHLPPVLLENLRQTLWHMHKDHDGSRILHQARLARFAPVSDSDYDPLRKMTSEATRITFPASNP